MAIEKKRNLASAKLDKNDEFYTQLTDVEKELRYYKNHFRDKVILCNCDDPFESNFFKYFVLNFNRLGLKKLIATCYSGSPIANQQLSLFDVIGEGEENENKPYKAIVTKVYDKTGDGGVDMFDVAELFKSGENQLEELQSDGDFRSPECIELLEEADIVVTNPPFSLFREYVAQLIDYDKKFLIIGNKNAITFKEIFPLLKDDKMWTGHRGFAGGMWFYSDYEGKTEKIIDDKKVINVPSIWFTNLDHRKRHDELILVKKYNSEEYPKYENFDAIEVSRTADIPCDYPGVMGVPITFMDKYCPDQFEIIGLGITELGKSIGVGNYDRQYKTPASRDGTLYYVKDGKGVVPYARVLIKNKHPEVFDK